MNGEQRYGVSLSRNQMAVWLMLGYVAFQSFVPLSVAYGAGDSPFIFNAAWGVGAIIGYTLILLGFFRGLVFSGEVWKVVRSHALSREMGLWVVSFLYLGVYAWSTRFIDVSVATALYETWPIFLVILTGWLFRMEVRYRKITPIAGFMFVVAFGGIALVIASQAGGFGAFFASDAGGGGGKSCDRHRAGVWRSWTRYFVRIRVQMGGESCIGVVA